MEEKRDLGAQFLTQATKPSRPLYGTSDIWRLKSNTEKKRGGKTQMQSCQPVDSKEKPQDELLRTPRFLRYLQTGPGKVTCPNSSSLIHTLSVLQHFRGVTDGQEDMGCAPEVGEAIGYSAACLGLILLQKRGRTLDLEVLVVLTSYNSFIWI